MIGEIFGNVGMELFFASLGPLSKYLKEGGLFSIPETVLQNRLDKMVEGIENVEGATITLKDDLFTIDVHTTLLKIVKNVLSSDFVIEEFVVQGKQCEVKIKSVSQVKLEGRNILGNVLGYLFSSIVLKILDKSSSDSISADKVYKINWPYIELDLMGVPEINQLLSMNVLGKGLTNFVELGPARISPNVLEVKISTLIAK